MEFNYPMLVICLGVLPTLPILINGVPKVRFHDFFLWMPMRATCFFGVMIAYQNETSVTFWNHHFGAVCFHLLCVDLCWRAQSMRGAQEQGITCRSLGVFLYLVEMCVHINDFMDCSSIFTIPVYSTWFLVVRQPRCEWSCFNFQMMICYVLNVSRI